MSTLPLLNQTALDDNGDPIPGAKLYFYESGTTTPLDTYSDEALATANANPVVADADGRWSAIYLKTDDSYTVVFKDASDITIWTRDDIKASALAGSSLATRVGQVASNPLDFGAAGAGADEATEVQAAIDAATGAIDLLGLTFRCDSKITLDSGLTLKNGTLDFSSCPDNTYIEILGTEGASNLCTADVSIGDSVVSVTTASGYVAGDLLKLKSDQAWSGSVERGDFQRIASISALDFTLAGESSYNLAALNNARVVKVSPKENIKLDGVTIVCNEGASGTGDAITLSKCRNVSFTNVRIESPKATGIKVSQSLNVSIRGLNVTGLTSIAAGVHLTDMTTMSTITGVTMSGIDVGIQVGSSTAISQDGPVYMTMISDCVMHGVNTGVDTTAGTIATRAKNGMIDVFSGGAAMTFSGRNSSAFGFSQEDENNLDGGNLGMASDEGPGISGAATSTGTTNAGVIGDGDNVGYGLIADPGTTGAPPRAPFRIGASLEPTGPNVHGDMYMSSAGKLYVCTVGGTPGTWTVVGAQT